MSDIFTPRPFGAPNSRPSSATVRPVKAFDQSINTDNKDRENKENIMTQSSAPRYGSGQRSTTVATVRPVLSSNSVSSSGNKPRDYNFNDKMDSYKQDDTPRSSRPGTQKPWESDPARKPEGSAVKRRVNRSRFMTISSSQPIKYTEQTPSPKKARVHSAAGDLISTVREVRFFSCFSL